MHVNIRFDRQISFDRTNPSTEIIPTCMVQHQTDAQQFCSLYERIQMSKYERIKKSCDEREAHWWKTEGLLSTTNSVDAHVFST